MPTQRTIVMAGVPTSNTTLFHRTRFFVGDSNVLIDDGASSLLLVRDIEMDRARRDARADAVGCAADYAPAGGLSGDRDTALAQAAAECLRRRGVTRATTDRTLPYIFAEHMRRAGIELEYDGELGVLERRVKQADELEALERAQRMTHDAMAMACGLIARATADRDGVLRHEGEALTSERVRRTITRYLIERGFSTPHDSIVVTTPHVADCHHFGTGPLKTGVPVIVDIFPRDEASRYNGDCTRTVVHGEASDEVVAMHAAVVEAHDVGIAALRPGVTGEQVHRAVIDVLTRHGYEERRGGGFELLRDDRPFMRHGTGHGIGLDVHEPILLDYDAGAMLTNEVFTVEPGLYSATHGGVRVEDMAVVTAAPNDVRVLGKLNTGLNWQ
ncbi:MAG: M24 family metallopeptidase [Phycisphaera sp.]|nr:M24 family metallopeptidase [Phycisphaera sp.]